MTGLKHSLAAIPALVAATLLTAAAPASATEGGIAGRWQTPDMGGIVEISPCGTAWCGRIVGGAFVRDHPDMRDTRNRDPALRNRPVQGLLIMTGFVGGPVSWKGGTIYRPLDGGTYSGSITMEGANRLFLKGCIVWPLCRTQTWNRVP